jgi:hypothetical protein
LNRFRSHKPSHLGALIVATVPLAVYVLTLQNGLTPGELQGGDPITHQYAQAALRFANAPGYPVFTMLGWFWFQLSALLTPFFNPIERLTFYSTLYAIPSLLLLYHLLLKAQSSTTLNITPAAPDPSSAVSHPSTFALLATLFFAFTYFFWYYAISSENYSSSVLLTLLMIALAWRWQERRDERTLLCLCFVCGLSLAHLLTVALAVPAVIAFVLGQQPGYLRRPKLLLKIVVAAFLPLLSYAYIYWRGAEHPEWRGQGHWPTTLAWFVDFLKTSQGQAELTWSWDGVPWPMLQLIANELTWLVFIGGLLGILLLPRWRALLLFGIVAVYAPELYVDRYGNWFQTVIALYPVFVLGFVVLLYRTYVLMHQHVTPLLSGITLTLLLVVLALSRLLGNYPADNLRDRPTATGLVPGWKLLADAPAPNALVAGSFEEDLALDFLTQVWGARPDLRTIALGGVNSSLDHPLYVSRSVMPLVSETLAASTHLSSHGLSLIALSAAPTLGLSTTARPVELPATHGVQLAAYTLRHADSQQHLTLYWRALQPSDIDMAVSARLTRSGQVIAQLDSSHPVAGYYPTTHWTAGEIVRDDYALSTPAGSAFDRISIILYRPTLSGFENLATLTLDP